MAKTALVESLIEDSITLVKQLDSGIYKPNKVVWYYYADIDVWRLIVVSHAFEEMLPKQELLAYKVIAESINIKDLLSLSIAKVKLMKNDDPLINTLRFLNDTRPDNFIKVHYSDTTINGFFINDMVILRSV